MVHPFTAKPVFLLNPIPDQKAICVGFVIGSPTYSGVHCLFRWFAVLISSISGIGLISFEAAFIQFIQQGVCLDDGEITLMLTDKEYW